MTNSDAMTGTDLIKMLTKSMEKRPKVSNYENISKMIPALKSMIAERGDITFPASQLEKFLTK